MPGHEFDDIFISEPIPVALEKTFQFLKQPDFRLDVDFSTGDADGQVISDSNFPPLPHSDEIGDEVRVRDMEGSADSAD